MRDALFNSRAEFVALVAVLVSTMALVGTFPPQELIRDSLGWAGLVETGQTEMWHPHHLIYMPINWLILHVLSDFCGSCTAITAGQLHGLFWSIVLGLTATVLFRRLTGSIWLGLLLALSLLTFRSVWVLLMQPQSYSASYALMALTITVLFATRQRQADWPRVVLISGIYALSVLYHQSMVLLGLPIAYYMIATRKNGWLTAMHTIGLAGAIVLAFYITVVYMVNAGSFSIQAFWQFITLFGQVMSDPNYFNVGNLGIDRIRDLAQAVVDSIVVLPWSLRALLTGILILYFLFIVAWNIWQIARQSEHSQERIFLLLIVGIFTLLCLWGSPGDYAWQVFILIPLMALTALAAGDFLRGNGFRPRLYPVLLVIMAASVALVAARNMSETIIPMHNNKGKDYAHAWAISSVVPKECIIFETNMLAYYNLIYYFKRPTADYWDIITAFFYADPAIISKKIVSDNDRKTHCIAVDSSYIGPGFTVSGYTGFNKADEWKKLITWLFDLRRTGQTQSSWRAFDVVVADNGRQYILIQAGQRELSSNPDELLQRLIKINLSHYPEVAENYLRWSKSYSLR